MAPIKRPTVAGVSHSLTGDEVGKRRRLLSASSSPMSSQLQEPASGPLAPTNSFFDEFEMGEREQTTSVPAAFNQSGQAAPYSGNGLHNSMEDILWSDDYGNHELSRVAATLAEYEAVLTNADLAAPEPRSEEYSHQGNSMEDILWSDDYGNHESSRAAAVLAEYEAVLANADPAAPEPRSEEYSHQGNSTEDLLWSDDFEMHESSRLNATLAEYEALLSNTDLASPSAEQLSGSRHQNSLSSEQRRALLNIFKNQPERSNASIAREFGFSSKVISMLRGRFNRTGNIERREASRRLNLDERQAILDIFKSNPKKSNSSIALDFDVSRPIIINLRKQFNKTGNLDPRGRSSCLNPDKRQAILNIFKSNPEKSISSIADEFDVSRVAISNLKKQFDNTGNVDQREKTNRLTPEERQAILNIFKSKPERSSASIAAEYNFNVSTIVNLRNQFSRTGNIDPRETTNRLTPEGRQAILNIFKDNPKKTNASIASKFGVNISTITKLRNRYRETGNIEPRELSRRMTPEERQAILNIFKNEPGRSTVSIANKFGFDRLVIAKLRNQKDRDQEA